LFSLTQLSLLHESFKDGQARFKQTTQDITALCTKSHTQKVDIANG